MEELRGVQREDKGSWTEVPNITQLKPLTHDAYGGGMYAAEQQGQEAPSGRKDKPPASKTQSADGPPGPTTQPKHEPPPSSGDRDVNITGLSYIQ